MENICQKPDLLENIALLSALPGVSGDEVLVREAILGQIKHCANEITVDPLGNLIVFKKGKATPAKRLLFSAHMDEVGFIITFIEESGLLRFAPVGGIDSRVVVGRGVEVGPRRLYGVIGTKAVHHQSNREQEEPLPIDRLAIDIGAKTKAEAEALVSPGDRAVFDSRFTKLGDWSEGKQGQILSKALDDRAGCAILIDMLHQDLPWDCYFTFTVQEENGCIGAIAAGYTVAPDIAVAVETTTASDIPGVSPDKAFCRFGAGPVVSFMDRGTVYDSGLYALALETARARHIPAQSKTGVAGGNESRSLQTSRGGARTLAVSMPCRYLHAPSCTLQVSDILHTRDLLLALCDSLGQL